MKIRKEFKVESAHIVRNASSYRCSHSIHGHSAVIEVFLTGNKLDNAGMIYDFGLMKSTIKEFIDSMDHCYILWKNDDENFKDFIKNNCDRWIELPFNPSAECLSLYLHFWINYILNHTRANNGEGDVRCCGVRYHETATGFAESCDDDFNDDSFWKNSWRSFSNYKFSEGVMRDWSEDLKNILLHYNIIDNPIIPQQVKID